MTDSTDNARGPEWAVLRAVKPDDWPETVHVGKAVIRFPNGVESGNWYSKPDDVDKTMPFVRADLAPDPLRAVKVRALVWEDVRWGNAYTVCGLYKAKIDDGGGAYSLTWGGKVIRDGDGRTVWLETLEAAKAAAQADYEARIRSALEPDTLADERVQELVDALQEAKINLEYAEQWEAVQKARTALAAFGKGGKTDA